MSPPQCWDTLRGYDDAGKLVEFEWRCSIWCTDIDDDDAEAMDIAYWRPQAGGPIKDGATKAST